MESIRAPRQGVSSAILTGVSTVQVGLFMDRGDDLTHCGAVGKSDGRAKVRCLKRLVTVAHLERLSPAKGNAEMSFVNVEKWPERPQWRKFKTTDVYR